MISHLSPRLRELTAASVLGVAFLSGQARLNADPVVDFALEDLNTTSPRHGDTVSPRDYLHQISGYYFGNPG